MPKSFFVCTLRFVSKNRGYFSIVGENEWHFERRSHPLKTGQSVFVDVSPAPEIGLPFIPHERVLQFPPFRRANCGQFADHGIGIEKSHKFYMRCGQVLAADGPTIAGFVDSPATDTFLTKRDITVQTQFN